MSETPKEPWMMTASGHAFPILHPKEEDFILSDIAHHLSQENRFNGAARFPYSVAQHLLYCYHQARQLDLSFDLQCEALFHDAHEAYCKDLTNPTKLGLRRITPLMADYSAYDELENIYEATLRRKFKLPGSKSSHVMEIDIRMLVTERQQLLPFSTHKWEWERDPLPWQPFDFRITFWSASMARAMWLESAIYILRKRGLNEHGQEI